MLFVIPKVEGKLRQLANSLAETRLAAILNERELSTKAEAENENQKNTEQPKEVWQTANLKF